jgi:hypothetical protein
MTTPVLPFTPVRPPRALGMWKWLLSGERNGWYYRCIWRQKSLELIWREHADEIVAHFARRWAGTRPALWWRWDAPGPRKRLGGVGTPAHECRAYAPNFEFGIPSLWRLPGDHLTRGTPIDPEDPPAFESEAAYLLRLNLLLPDELARLLPEDFDPEEID